MYHTRPVGRGLPEVPCMVLQKKYGLERDKLVGPLWCY